MGLILTTLGHIAQAAAIAGGILVMAALAWLTVGGDH